MKTYRKADKKPSGIVHRFLGWALLSALCFVSNPAMSQPVHELKILTFNIWKQGSQGLNNCIEVVRSSGADIVGLQECNATTAQTIATGLGFYVLPGTDCSIVSRYPILATFTIGNSRGITVRLSPTQRAHVFNCHPAAYPYGPYDLHDGKSLAYILDQENAVRLPAVKQVLSVMKPYIDSFEPCFLTGDFNAPSHLDYADVPWPTSIACVEAGLTDSYRSLHSSNRTYPAPFAYNDPGVTWTPRTSEEPNGVFDRIDFVYYATRAGVSATASTELDERNSVNPWPSDHRAVLTTFSITPVPQAEKATLPTPSALATNVPINPVLFWQPGTNSTNHMLYLGTNSSPAWLLNTTNSSVSLTNLRPATTYYWRVDELTPAGIVTGDVWSFTTRREMVFEWNFSKGTLEPSLGNGILSYADLTSSNQTAFGRTDGSTVPHINGTRARYLRVPAFAGNSNGLLADFTGTMPNGGGEYLNQYTLMFDLLLPSPLGWCAIFNTSTVNSNDADFYIADNGSLGIGDIGYSSSGVIKPNTWSRVAIVTDLQAGTITYYVNGTQVRTGKSGLDGRFAMFTGLNPGPDLLLFNEGDNSGVYTHAVYLSCMMFTDRPMAAAEISALGTPKAQGIFTPATKVKLAVNAEKSGIQLSWEGGMGPFQVQKSQDLSNNAAWEDLGNSTLSTNATLSPTNDSVFFRVVDLGE